MCLFTPGVPWLYSIDKPQATHPAGGSWRRKPAGKSYQQECENMTTEEKIQYILARLPEAGEYEIDQVYEFLLEVENET